MTRIAELFGVKVVKPETPEHPNWHARHCPFTGVQCDVTANRNDQAFLNYSHAAVKPSEAAEIQKQYSSAPMPLGICSLLTQRQNEKVARPWIVCPKRLLDIRQDHPGIPPEVRELIPIAPGTTVRCWWEVKFRYKDAATSNFFEFTFDYLLVPTRHRAGGNVDLVGPPYIVEVMTSSTRGGGLTEHMVDVLLKRPQRSLGSGVVKSPYTPNYRQVFGRMMTQFFAKSEVAEAWGGQALWLIQDVLLEYIEQTTDFRSAEFDADTGNVAMLVYTMKDMGDRYDLAYDRTLRGITRDRDAHEPYFTHMLGLGYEPPVEALYKTLQSGSWRTQPSSNWRDIIW